MSRSSLLSALPMPFAGGDSSSRHSKTAESEVTELFDALRDPLLRYLLSIGLPADDGEEIVQEAFLALFKHLRQSKSDRNLPGWMFRVVHNLGLKRRARNATLAGRCAQVAHKECGEHPDPSPSIEERLLMRQHGERLRATLQSLPEQDQFCLHLRAEGLRYRQIAAVLGISLGGVALSLQRSLARLRAVEGKDA